MIQRPPNLIKIIEFSGNTKYSSVDYYRVAFSVSIQCANEVTIALIWVCLYLVLNSCLVYWTGNSLSTTGIMGPEFCSNIYRLSSGKINEWAGTTTGMKIVSMMF